MCALRARAICALCACVYARGCFALHADETIDADNALQKRDLCLKN